MLKSWRPIIQLNFSEIFQNETDIPIRSYRDEVYTNKIPINRRIYNLLQMVQRETHPANRPPAPFDPLQPEVQLRGRKKKEREKKKHRINGIKRKRGQKRERERKRKSGREVGEPRISSEVAASARFDESLTFEFSAGPQSFPFWSFFFFFPSLFFYSSPRWRPSPPTKPPANPLWCTANIRRLSLVSPPQFVFSLATPFDQYFNFAMLRYLAGPKRTGRADARERSVVVPRGGIHDVDDVDIDGPGGNLGKIVVHDFLSSFFQFFFSFHDSMMANKGW